MGAAENSVLVHQNASIANSILFGALDFSDPRRDKVVITELDSPAMSTPCAVGCRITCEFR